MGSKGSQTTTQTTSNAPDAQALAAYRDILSRAQGVASQPYQPYTGELVAPVNQQQNMGISGINANANWAQPYVQNAIGQAASSSAPLSASAIQSYMNPYTQNVINATQAQFNHQNAVDLQNSRGNSIANGALGGNRQAVKEALLAEGQQRAQSPVIAGLYQQGYGQALNTAQNQQALGLQGAGLQGNLGIAGQGAGLQGAQSQIGAGSLQQNTQQMLDAAQMQQWQQQQAYPYQQLQWLAGIGTGVGSQMGGTSTGQTTGPPPNQTSSILGGLTSGVGLLGATGAFGSTGWLASALPMMAFSDKRLKENIHEIGKLHDGQKIYRFNYKGDPQTQVGLLAQEVEKHKPDAVAKANGVRLVDYDKATEDAIPGRASGGVAPMPYGDAALTYIPTVNIAHGNTMPRQAAPSLPKQDSSDLNKQAASIGDLAKTLRGAMSSSPEPQDYGTAIPGAVGPTSVGGALGPAPLVDFSTQPLARGGVAHGFANGGSPFADRFDAVYDGMYHMQGNPDEYAQWQKGVDEDNNPQDIPEPALEAKGVAPVSSPAPSRALAFSGTPSSESSMPSEITRGYSEPSRSEGVGEAASTPQERNTGVNFGADSKLWPSLISAGFGMMASRSPFLGVAIGEGGQAGINSYNLQQQRESDALKFAQQQKLQRERMQMEKERGERPYKELTMGEKARQEMAERQWKRMLMAPVKIGVDAMGREINAQRMPDGSLRVIDPYSGRLLEPGESLGGFGSTNNPLKSSAAARGAEAPMPTAPRMIQASETLLDDPKLPGYMRVANETPPRDDAVLSQVENMPGGRNVAAIVKGLVNYEIDPAKLSNRSGARDNYIALAKQYDPSFDQTLYNAKAAGVKEFFAGGPQSPAGTMTAGNTAILHLGEMYDVANEMEKNVKDAGIGVNAANWVGESGIPFISQMANQVRNSAARGTGTEFANNLSQWDVAKTRFADEVTKFYAGSGGSEGERERALKVLDEAKSWSELKSAIRFDLRLMRDKVEQMQGRITTAINPGIWKDVAKKDPSLILLYKNSRDVSDKILSGAGGHGPTAAPKEKTEAPKKAAKDRFGELRASGMSREDAYKKLKEEGY